MAEDGTRGGMPLVVCQVGSGMLALLSIAGCGALIYGALAFMFWIDPPGQRRAPSVYGPYFVGAMILALLGVWWWHWRKSYYVKCLRFWHPEIAPPKKVACPECRECELCNGTRLVDEGASLPDDPDDLWIDQYGKVWHGPLTVEGSNFHYAMLAGFEGADDGGRKPSWVLGRSDADPTWLPFEWPEAQS